jgi:DNA-binding response OmpR family regulator
MGAETEHILVVEANTSVRDTLELALQHGGYRAAVVNGGSAMRAFLDTDKSVDLVVLDASLPGDEGISIAQYLRELRMPLVMISGSPSIIEFAGENGLQLLEKPFKIGDLLAAVAVAFKSGEFGQREEASADHR